MSAGVKRHYFALNPISNEKEFKRFFAMQCHVSYLSGFGVILHTYGQTWAKSWSSPSPDAHPSLIARNPYQSRNNIGKGYRSSSLRLGKCASNNCCILFHVPFGSVMNKDIKRCMARQYGQRWWGPGKQNRCTRCIWVLVLYKQCRI